MILRLVNAGHEDVGFSLLRTMVLPQTPPGEALNAGNFFIRQLVRARRVRHRAGRGGGMEEEGTGGGLHLVGMR